VKRELTINQKQQSVDDLEQYLAIFNRNKDEFFRRYIAMDETWLIPKYRIVTVTIVSICDSVL
jgi:hypothetical protein